MQWLDKAHMFRAGWFVDKGAIKTNFEGNVAHPSARTIHSFNLGHT